MIKILEKGTAPINKYLLPMKTFIDDILQFGNVNQQQTNLIMNKANMPVFRHSIQETLHQTTSKVLLGRLLAQV